MLKIDANLIDKHYQLDYLEKLMTQQKAMKKLLLPLVLMSEIAMADDSSDTVNLDAIIVSAELLDKSAKESAQSIEIYDEDTLKNQAGLNSAKDILNTTSNVNLVKGTGTAATVRGIDGTGAAQNTIAIYAGGRQRLNYEVDDRPLSFNEVVYSDINLFDVEKVEVLRGAQSTLSGRNAMAGTINIKTKDPVYEDETILRAAAGNYDAQELSAAVNRTIGGDDTMAYRLSADLKDRDSTVKYGSTDNVDDVSRYESVNLRGKLLIEPDSEDNKRLLLGVSHTDYAGPHLETVAAPYEDRKAATFDGQAYHNTIADTVSLDYSQDLNSDTYFRLNSSLTNAEFIRTTADNGTNVDIDSTEIVLEPQLHYSNETLSLVAGIYYYSAAEEEDTELFSTKYRYNDDTEALSAYIEGAFNLSDNLTLSLGGRQEHESRKRDGGVYSNGATSNDFDYDENYSQFLPKVGINWQQSEMVSWGAQISKGYNAGGAGIFFDNSFAVQDYDFKEETSWTYEIYSRQQFLQGKLSSSQNLFYSRYKDLQLAYSSSGDFDNDLSYLIANVDKVNTWGFEQGLTAILSDEFTLSGSLGFLNTEIVEFSSDTSLEGNDLAIAPSVTSSISLDWHKDNWTTNLNLRYSGAYYTYPNNESASKTDAYVVANARATYQMGDAQWFASIDNLFDEDAIIYQRSTSAVLLQPRTFLVGVEYAL
ncbi:TonB-dependent receptor [Marinomonas aquiplantarum]|uniref:Outer membrane receptor protein involved in Fe transport n=1 Tax=Marinomonas aquiplantarum TaxID=491951 RepID=A0A366D3V7_9GAMM|nr:TonB-dependent receptor [Marinomonas aquiplantarum]RBO84179.1 outer membrane receptor protein involved in Fe transport [Marinomonas aquiplantarum]